MVSATFPPQTITPPNPSVGFTQTGSSSQGGGTLTQPALQHLQQSFDYISGTSRWIPCNVTGTNLITISPLPDGPTIKNYADYDTYQFTAAHTSTGAVTAEVQPPNGQPFQAIKVYDSKGATQLGSGDIVANQFYAFLFNGLLDSGNGGFVSILNVPVPPPSIVKATCVTATAGQVNITPIGVTVSAYNDLDTYMFRLDSSYSGPSLHVQIGALGSKIVVKSNPGNTAIVTGNAGTIYIISWSSALGEWVTPGG